MTDTPSDPDSYPTFMDAAIAGVVKPADIDDWVEKWHDGSSGVPLPAFLGLTEEQYSTWATRPEAIETFVREARDAIDGPVSGPFQLRFGIPASAQESSFANATLTSLDSGHAISIALTPPRDYVVRDPEVVRSMMKGVLRRLVDTGWSVDIQIGPDDQAG
jgi:hypothetical protein